MGSSEKTLKFIVVIILLGLNSCGMAVREGIRMASHLPVDDAVKIGLRQVKHIPGAPSTLRKTALGEDVILETESVSFIKNLEGNITRVPKGVIRESDDLPLVDPEKALVPALPPQLRVVKEVMEEVAQETEYVLPKWYIDYFTGRILASTLNLTYKELARRSLQDGEDRETWGRRWIRDFQQVTFEDKELALSANYQKLTDMINGAASIVQKKEFPSWDNARRLQLSLKIAMEDLP